MINAKKEKKHTALLFYCGNQGELEKNLSNRIREDSRTIYAFHDDLHRSMEENSMIADTSIQAYRAQYASETQRKKKLTLLRRLGHATTKLAHKKGPHISARKI